MLLLQAYNTTRRVCKILLVGVHKSLVEQENKLDKVHRKSKEKDLGCR